MNRQALRAQRRALRRELPALRRRARARVEALPQVKERKRRKRWKQLALVALVLLLALFAKCDCAHAPGAAATQTETSARVLPPPLAAPRKPVHAKTESQKRARYSVGESPTPSWLETFHMQVAARSSRLAECFHGVERPGALRWTTFVNAREGAVSESELEGIGAGSDVTEAQRACLGRVLANPPYALGEKDAEALPRRVSLVIEF